MTDPTGFLLTSIRDYPAVKALTTRVRGGEPAAGDALGAGKYQRFVVISMLGSRREKRVPVREVRYAVRCYGITYADTAVLAGAVSDSIHNIGPRTSPSGVLVYRSFDDGGDSASADPGTGQPYLVVVVAVYAATEAMPIG